MGKTTSAERMKKLRDKRKADPEYDEEKEREKERERMRKIRLKKKNTPKDDSVLKAERAWETARKRDYRKRQKQKAELEASESSADGRQVANKKRGVKERRANLKKSIDKIKLFSNNLRKLKRQNKKLLAQLPSTSPTSSSPDTPDNILLDAVSPGAKRRAKRKLKLDTTLKAQTVKALRLDKVEVQHNESEGHVRNQETKRKVQEWMLRDENSICVPDKKVKEGTRYRLASLEMLHMKYLSECTSVDEEVSYSHFTRLIPGNIIKPKPESWGTCLCMPCINTELKVSALRGICPCELEKLRVKEEQDRIIGELAKCKENIDYLEWKKIKTTKAAGRKETKKENEKTTYQSTKTACSASSKEFAEIFVRQLEEYFAHIDRAKSQYRRIREIKNQALTPGSDCKLLRLDWSENVELFQTLQEKSQYYYSVTASVNTGVLYDSGGIRSVATISDVKSHKAEATMASMEAILEEGEIDLTGVTVFYIVTDSPTSQYRNKKVMYLIKRFAGDKGIAVCWIYTEKGHGKGPMDGVGAAVKRVVSDTIAYNPKSVIRNTDQLMAKLPIMNVEVSTYSEKDVRKYVNLIPTPLRKLKLSSDCGFNIGSCHEVFISSVDDGMLQMKKLSSDLEYGNCRICTNFSARKKGKRKVISVQDVNELGSKDSDEEVLLIKFLFS